MARLSPKGGVAGRRGGSHLRMAVLGLVVLASVLGMLNMAPASLHAELHTSSTRKELRQLTGACPPLCVSSQLLDWPAGWQHTDAGPPQPS